MHVDKKHWADIALWLCTHLPYCELLLLIIIMLIKHVSVSSMHVSLAPPRINESTSTPVNPQVIVGNSITIQCNAHGVPTPEIQWLNNGRPVDTGSTASSESHPKLRTGIANILLCTL